MRSGICDKGPVPAASVWAKLVYAGEKLVFFAAVSALAGVIFINRQAFVPLLSPVIEDVRLQGQFVHLERLHVDRLAQDSIGQYFFSIDLQAIQRAIEALPRVKHARVIKVWPRTLSVTIEEHRAEARWGTDALISSESVVFRPGRTTDRHLPLLYAREGRETVTLARYREAKRLFAQVGAPGIEMLAEDPLGEWRIQLAGGISVKVGDTDWERRLQRFAVVWQSELREESERIRYVDLRYSDGCAVAWRS